MIVGAGNSVNMTDGLDGLAIVPVMIACGTFGFIAYLVGNSFTASYLQVNYVRDTGELAVVCGAVIGAGLGFLWFNAPPAQIFMGDTGSLALGGLLGTIAVATKHEIVLAIVGGLFVLEMMSVIIQVASFKLTGKRVFRMAPIHHHFEQKGWKEPQVVIRFWIIAVILALAGLGDAEAALKICATCPRTKADPTQALILRCRSVAEASKEPSRDRAAGWRAPSRPASRSPQDEGVGGSDRSCRIQSSA